MNTLRIPFVEQFVGEIVIKQIQIMFYHFQLGLVKVCWIAV